MMKTKFLALSVPLIFCWCASGAEQPADAAEKPEENEERDLVKVIQIDGEAMVRRVLEHKTFSPDRSRFAGYYRDGWDEVISIHDAGSGEQLRRIVGHGDEVREFKFTPDGKMNHLKIPTHGSVGLQDAAVCENSLYLTSDWGSGILRTALYRVRCDKGGGIETKELGVLSSSPAGLVDEEFLKDETVVEVRKLLRPLKTGKGQPVTAPESKPAGGEKERPGGAPGSGWQASGVLQEIDQENRSPCVPSVMKTVVRYLGERGSAMKHRAITTAFLMVLACFQSAWAYSAIWNVDGWDTTRLKEAGISVTTWKHDQIGEDPAMNWVKITYDPSKLREAPNVLMTLHVIGDDGQTVSAFRAERKKGEADKLVILCAVRKENMENSYLQILVPKLLSEGDKRAFGDPGFGGYSLRLSRIMELAGKVAVEQAAESEKE